MYYGPIIKDHMTWREDNKFEVIALLPAIKFIYKGALAYSDIQNNPFIIPDIVPKKMPPRNNNHKYKRFGSFNQHGDRWRAQRPHMGKNVMWALVSPK